MTAAQVMIFNPTGQFLVEMQPDIESVGWRLNNVAMARLFLAYEDNECTPTNLASGNRVLIRFDNGLPDWGGVIDFPRRRSAGGVRVTCYTGEKLFDWRVTAKGQYFDGRAPGYIYKKLIEEENNEGHTGADIGDIWTGGTGRSLEYHYQKLLKRIKDLAKLSGEEFVVLPVYEDGAIWFWANWHEKRGVDRSSDVLLVEGINVVGTTLDEQGPIGNKIILAGAGQTWGSDRIDSVEEDTDSQALYGVREWSQVQSGVKLQETLDANAAELLDTLKDPRLRFGLQVSDRAPGTFGMYDIGDVVTLQAFLKSSEWAFDGSVRVIAREWRPDNTCRLEVVSPI